MSRFRRFRARRDVVRLARAFAALEEHARAARPAGRRTAWLSLGSR